MIFLWEKCESMKLFSKIHKKCSKFPLFFFLNISGLFHACICLWCHFFSTVRNNNNNLLLKLIVILISNKIKWSTKFTIFLSVEKISNRQNFSQKMKIQWIFIENSLFICLFLRNTLLNSLGIFWRFHKVIHLNVACTCSGNMQPKIAGIWSEFV